MKIEITPSKVSTKTKIALAVVALLTVTGVTAKFTIDSMYKNAFIYNQDVYREQQQIKDVIGEKGQLAECGKGLRVLGIHGVYIMMPESGYVELPKIGSGKITYGRYTLETKDGKILSVNGEACNESSFAMSAYEKMLSVRSWTSRATRADVYRKYGEF